jgi:hypothetical protein
MRFRKLRIAWSVVCGIACVLLIGLWVRSYYVCDSVHVPTWGSMRVGALRGIISIAASRETSMGWTWNAIPTARLMPVLGSGPTWSFRSEPPYTFLVFPHRLLIAISGMLCIAPWIRWRFTLRTLLIATTLVALVLGVIAWAVR